MDILEGIILETVENRKEDLYDISQKLWKNPELGFQEVFAHKLLTDFLEKNGFSVERNYHLPTAFRAEHTVSGSGRGPTVCVICEYDALPGIGHGCGHNLIAEAGIGAALGIKAAMDSGKIQQGRLVVLGTPAEEGGGGKIILLKAGALKGVDIALMAHPFDSDVLENPVLGNAVVNVKYTGHEAHASSFPWKGKNALDAAVLAYCNLSLRRQQMKPMWRLHGIFTDGGSKPNITPSHASLEFYFRAPTKPESEELKTAAIQCFEAAAMATGTTVEMDWDENSYEPFHTNEPLLETYSHYGKKLGLEFVLPHRFAGSTDMGNVTQVVPGIHPMYWIPKSEVSAHTKEFTVSAGDSAAQPPTLKTAKCLALTATQFLIDGDLRERVCEAFKKSPEVM